MGYQHNGAAGDPNVGICRWGSQGTGAELSGALQLRKQWRRSRWKCPERRVHLRPGWKHLWNDGVWGDELLSIRRGRLRYSVRTQPVVRRMDRDCPLQFLHHWISEQLPGWGPSL